MVTIKKTEDKWAIHFGYLFELENEEKEYKEYFRTIEEIYNYLINNY